MSVSYMAQYVRLSSGEYGFDSRHRYHHVTPPFHGWDTRLRISAAGVQFLSVAPRAFSGSGVRAGPGRDCKSLAGWFDSNYPHSNTQTKCRESEARPGLSQATPAR